MIFLLALVPAVVFGAVLTVAAPSGAATGGGGALLLLVLTFVILPALIPLGAARTNVSRGAALVLLCAVAATSAFLVMSGDGQAGFAIFLNLYFAPLIAALVRLGEWVLSESRVEGDREWVPASIGDRLTALAVDVAVLWAICVLPASALKDSGAQIEAAAFVVAAGACYFGGLLYWRQRTLGQALMWLAVVDAETFGPLTAGRAALRGLITTAEVGGTAIFLLAPLALADFASAAWFGGRSLTDRLVGTLVLAHRPRTGAAVATPTPDWEA